MIIRKSYGENRSLLSLEVEPKSGRLNSATPRDTNANVLRKFEQLLIDGEATGDHRDEARRERKVARAGINSKNGAYDESGRTAYVRMYRRRPVGRRRGDGIYSLAYSQGERRKKKIFIKKKKGIPINADDQPWQVARPGRPALRRRPGEPSAELASWGV